MKTAKILYPAVAVLKKSIIDKCPSASVYKVARYASFIIAFPGKPIEESVYCGDPDMLMRYAKENHLSVIPKNAQGRRFFEYTINK